MVDSTLSSLQPHISDPIAPDNVTEVDPQVIAQLPKVDLHDHLDGGLRPATIIEIAADIGYDKLPTTDPDELEKWFFDAANSGDLPTYLLTFDHSTAVMQRAEDIRRVAQEAIEDLGADNVVYAELRFAPEQHLNAGLSLNEVVDAAIEGVQAGERAAAEAGHNIIGRLLLCGMRQAQRTAEIAELTRQYVAKGPGYVVGFDIAGPEAGFPPADHAEAFTTLRESLVPFTIHAGEADGVDSIADALHQGAERLGHGARVYEDFTADLDGVDLQQVSAAVRDRQRVLELCPTSNVQTGVCESVADHPFQLLYEMGFACTVNPDNRLVSGTTMTKEMSLLVEHFDFGYEDLLRITLNAINAAFAPLPIREQLIRQVIMPAYAEFIDPDQEPNPAAAAADDVDETGA